MTSLYDAHNHFQDDWLQPHRAGIDAALRSAGVKCAIVNGTSEQDWPDVVALARQYDWIRPSFGLHPWDAGNRSANWQKNLLSALAATDQAAKSASTGASTKAGSPPEAVAKVGVPPEALAKVGEIGLDRWILESAKPDDPRLAGLRRAPLEEQTEVFVWQLELAAERNCAASIHCLAAFGALLDVLSRARLPARGFLLHAYGGPTEMVKKFADLGAYFSFNGSFLDGRHAAKQETFKHIPGGRLLVETDAPAMRLPPAREIFPPLSAPDGALANHPANIAAAYAGLAELRGVALASLADQVEANFVRLFL